jgi:thioredoxin reductase
MDNGKPCNIQTPHSHNFLTHDGKTPKEISTIAKADVAKYETLSFYDGLAISAKKVEGGFEISTETNEHFTTKKIIFATGIKDILPNIKGFSECWGISIVHCPYCHGYEHRNQPTGIIANGPKAFHLASMVNNLSKNIRLFTNGKADLSAEQLEKLAKHDIKIIETPILEIEHKEGKMKGLIFEDQTKIDLEITYAAIPFVQHSTIPESLGCELTEHGYININAMQKTTVEHVYACGDNSNMMRSVANAVASGNIAGAVANGELVQEQF